MKRVLSIDFDICMGRVLPIYNACVPADWNRIIADFPAMADAPMDFEIYKQIGLFLTHPDNLNKEIYFADNHDKILNFLEEEKDDLIITNIDFHHDLGYDDGTKKAIDCANWAKYLLDNDSRVKSYIWVHSPYSNVEEKKQQYSYIHHNFFDYKLMSHIGNFDKIFICLSPEWVPPTYYNLFDMLNFQVENITGKPHPLDTNKEPYKILD